MLQREYEMLDYFKAHQARLLQEAAQARKLNEARQEQRLTTKPRRFLWLRSKQANGFAR